MDNIDSAQMNPLLPRKYVKVHKIRHVIYNSHFDKQINTQRVQEPPRVVVIATLKRICADICINTRVASVWRIKSLDLAARKLSLGALNNGATLTLLCARTLHTDVVHARVISFWHHVATRSRFTWFRELRSRRRARVSVYLKRHP